MFVTLRVITFVYSFILFENFYLKKPTQIPMPYTIAVGGGMVVPATLICTNFFKVLFVFSFLDNCLRFGVLLSMGVKNTGSVACANIVALAIWSSGAVYFKKALHKLCIAKFLGIKADHDSFSVACLFL